MLLAWVVATVVIIGVGGPRWPASTAPTTTRPAPSPRPPGELTEERFGGYSGQEIYVAWKDPAGAQSAAAQAARSTPSSPRPSRSTTSVPRPTEVRVSQDGKIGSTTLPLAVAGRGRPQGRRREADRRRRRSTAATGCRSELRGDPIYAAQEAASPEGLGFLGAAIVLLIAFGSVVAAGLPLLIALFGLGISSGGLIVLLANVVDVPDWTTAVSGLIGIGVGIDYALFVLTRFRASLNDGNDPHDAIVEAVTTAGRSVILARARSWLSPSSASP